MISYVKAKKIADKPENELKTFKAVSDYIRAFADLGFHNCSILVAPQKVNLVVSKLEESGFDVFFSGDYLEVEWF